MATLTIKGSKAQLAIIVRQNRLRTAKYGLDVSLDEAEDVKPKEAKKVVRKKKSTPTK